MTTGDDLAYDEVIESQGVRVPFVPAIITPRIERPLRNGRYEARECQHVRGLLQRGDRVLELGTGLGVVSASIAATGKTSQITTIEANPELLPLIHETHRLSGSSGIELRNGVVTANMVPDCQFYLRSHFWASSTNPDSRPFQRAVTVPALNIGALIAELDPTVLIIDIEGGELGLLDAVDLSGVRAVVIEMHPKLYGEPGVQAITDVLVTKGLIPRPGDTPDATVQLFSRSDAQPAFPGRAGAVAQHQPPRVLIGTCMKDEGPFILEWLAWHKSMGITDFVIFTNDCTDGTDALLDHLDDRGDVTHLPNPALATGDAALQPIALNYLHHMRQMDQADYFISMDVDEFLTVRVGDGSFQALLDAAGPFDVLSVTELNHGSNGREAFEPGWLTEQFPCHQRWRPGAWRSARGVKSITRLSDKVARLRNHRPDMLGDIRWLDGSGRETTWLRADGSRNGVDCRGTYDLASLDHFALRSVDSYLVKMFRGDVVVKNKRVSQRYWRHRNRHQEPGGHMEPRRAIARALYDREFATDPQLMELHRACETAHRARIKALAELPEFAERRHWILTEAWDIPGQDAAQDAPRDQG